PRLLVRLAGRRAAPAAPHRPPGAPGRSGRPVGPRPRGQGGPGLVRVDPGGHGRSAVVTGVEQVEQVEQAPSPPAAVQTTPTGSAEGPRTFPAGRARPALRVGILGGGALGLAAALRLTQAGCRVTLLEREPRLGGLAVGFRVGPSDLEKFYHHIFGTDTTIIRLIAELGLGQRLVWAQPDTSVLWRGRMAGLDSPGDVLRFPFLPPPDRLRLAAVLALLKVVPDERPFAGQTATRWLRRT